VGYRWYDANNVEPLFPFGHGLSYVEWKYDNIKVDGRKVTVDITNLGDYEERWMIADKEVVQLYVGFPKEAGEPPKLLKGFEKIQVRAGYTETVEFELRDRDLSIWDVETHGWKLIEGDFDIYVGSSSRDIRQTATMTVEPASFLN